MRTLKCRNSKRQNLRGSFWATSSGAMLFANSFSFILCAMSVNTLEESSISFPMKQEAINYLTLSLYRSDLYQHHILSSHYSSVKTASIPSLLVCSNTHHLIPLYTWFWSILFYTCITLPAFLAFFPFSFYYISYLYCSSIPHDVFWYQLLYFPCLLY